MFALRPRARVQARLRRSDLRTMTASRFHQRVRRLEAVIRPVDRCHACGAPERCLEVFRIRPGQVFGRCDACGRRLLPDGRPLDRDERIKVIRSPLAMPDH